MVMITEQVRVIPFDILRGAEWKKKNYVGGGSAEKIKYVRRVGEKIKICEGDSTTFSILPPPQDLKWKSPYV